MQNQKQINVALACVIDDRKILLTKRREEEQPDINGMWELPGGKVEFKESPLNTAVREVKEETGCDVSEPASLPFPYITVRQYKDFILHAIIFCFECKLIHKAENFTTSSSKILDIKWIDIFDIKFMDIIPGSREFIHWIIQQKYESEFDWKETFSDSFQSYIHFECYKPSENQEKFYFINVDFDPNPSTGDRYKLSRFWGKINSRNKILSKYSDFINPVTSNLKIEYYEDESSVKKRMIALAKKRIDGDYRIIDHTTNIPIKGWLKEHREYIQTSAKPTVQLELDLHGTCTIR